MKDEYWDDKGFHLLGTLWLVSPVLTNYGVPDPDRITPEKPPVPEKPVSKVTQIVIDDSKLSQAQNKNNYETSKSKLGRPKKLDKNISRTTKWRRKKELQGVLL